jgi:hypothetical protein
MLMRGFEGLYEDIIGGKKVNMSRLVHPPMKKIIKCIADMTRCKYSAKKNISNMEPLYSVE